MSGPLINSRQERFAQELFKGATATAAYVTAGYKPHDGAAARLRGNVRITARVAELHAETAELAKIDAAWVLAKSVKLLESCEKEGDRSNAKGVLKMIGEHVAVQAFRHQLGLSNPGGGPIQVEDLSKLSDDELETYGRLARKLAGNPANDREAA